MVERVRPRSSCSADSWQACLVAMNEQKPVVRVVRAALEDVVKHHLECGGRIPLGLVSRPGRRHMEVVRPLLWDLVQAHGKVCES